MVKILVLESELKGLHLVLHHVLHKGVKMITLRTDRKLEEELEKTARAKGMTKSEIVRQGGN